MILNKKLENYWLILQSLPSWECGLKSYSTSTIGQSGCVAPFVGVWIEMIVQTPAASCLPSLPSWECGLKYQTGNRRYFDSIVAPFVGVWIEIVWNHCSPHKLSVAPFVGVWIEICKSSFVSVEIVSLPSWEC